MASILAILRPARRQVNAEGYEGEFRLALVAGGTIPEGTVFCGLLFVLGRPKCDDRLTVNERVKSCASYSLNGEK
jgi:hypothetical protein